MLLGETGSSGQAMCNREMAKKDIVDDTVQFTVRSSNYILSSTTSTLPPFILYHNAQANPKHSLLPVHQYPTFTNIFLHLLTLSQTTNFRLFQTERVCRLQFQVC